jgi:hypothetical protein
MLGDVGDRGSSLCFLGVIGEASRVAALDQVGSTVGTSQGWSRTRYGLAGLTSLAVAARGSIRGLGVL